MERIVKLDSQFRKKYIVRNIKKIIPSLGGFILLWHSWGRFSVEAILGLVFFVGGILFWVYQDRTLFRSYNCPKCGKHILEKEDLENKGRILIHYFCDSCNIQWNTGLSFPQYD